MINNNQPIQPFNQGLCINEYIQALTSNTK